MGTTDSWRYGVLGMTQGVSEAQVNDFLNHCDLEGAKISSSGPREGYVLSWRRERDRVICIRWINERSGDGRRAAMIVWALVVEEEDLVAAKIGPCGLIRLAIERGYLSSEPPEPVAVLPELQIVVGHLEDQPQRLSSRWPYDPRVAEALISLFIHGPGMVVLEGRNDDVSRLMDYAFLLAPGSIREVMILDGLAVEVGTSRYVRQGRRDGTFPPPLGFFRVPGGRGIPGGMERRECGTVIEVMEGREISFKERRHKKAASTRGVAAMAKFIGSCEEHVGDASLLIEIHGKLRQDQLREALVDICRLSPEPLRMVSTSRAKEMCALIHDGLEPYRSSGTRFAARMAMKAIVQTATRGIIVRMVDSETIRPHLMDLAANEAAMRNTLVGLALDGSPELLRALLASRHSLVRAEAMGGVLDAGKRPLTFREMRAILEGLDEQEEEYDDIWMLVALRLITTVQARGQEAGIRDIAGLLLSKADPVWEHWMEKRSIIKTIYRLSGWLPKFGYKMRRLSIVS